MNQTQTKTFTEIIFLANLLTTNSDIFGIKKSELKLGNTTGCLADLENLENLENGPLLRKIRENLEKSGKFFKKER